MPDKLPGTFRIATWHADLTRRGPGLLLRDIDRAGPDAPPGQISAVIGVIATLNADIIVLTGIDHDTQFVALNALGDALMRAGVSYPYLFALAPNSGVPTGLDLDRDGRKGGPRDAMGYGWFQGEGGIALLSRYPVMSDAAEDYTGFLWADLPGTLIPPDTPAEERAIQRLSSTNHWQAGVTLPDGQRLGLLAWSATPPVFDGPEDRNGRRNHDEAAFWLRLLDGSLPYPRPEPPFVILGDASLDPEDGDGRPEAIAALLRHPALQDPQPRGTHGITDAGHKGDPDLDTAWYPSGPGGLRVDYVLPSADLRVADAGVFRPAYAADGTPSAHPSRHAPVWVDIVLPGSRFLPGQLDPKRPTR